MIFLISPIISILGIGGFFTDIDFLLYFAMLFVIVEYIVELVSGRLKSASTLFAAIFIGILLSFFDINIFDSIAFCICIENLIMTVTGLWFMYKLGKSNQPSPNFINTDKPTGLFASENCLEILDLVLNKWSHLPNSNSIYRVKDLQDFYNLITATSKIVIVFNLLLDLDTVYTNIRIYMNKVKTINEEYVVNTNSLLNDYIIMLKYIIDYCKFLENDPYFDTYKEAVQDVIDMHIRLMQQVNQIISTVTEQLKNNATVQKIIDVTYGDCSELMKITDIYTNCFDKLDKIVYQNDASFNYLKTLDSERYKNIKKVILR